MVVVVAALLLAWSQDHFCSLGALIANRHAEPFAEPKFCSLHALTYVLALFPLQDFRRGRPGRRSFSIDLLDSPFGAVLNYSPGLLQLNRSGQAKETGHRRRCPVLNKGFPEITVG